MAVAYIECAAGASGDMFLGALLDLGVPEDVWREQLAGLSVKEFEITLERVKKKGISALHAQVHTHHSHHHRHLPDIQKIIDASSLPEIVKSKSKEAFYHLAVAEAAVHGTTPERIHFHEVGAVDAIVDIVGAMAAWYLLGQPECVVTPIEVSGGTVKCEHGIMPVPAPAVATLLQGFPTYSSGTFGETTTPTGAAIIRTLAKLAPKRPFVSQRVGYGAGTKDFPFANVLRIQLGEWLNQSDPTEMDTSVEGDDGKLPQAVRAVMIEANIDDMNPEWAGYLVDKLFELGAMDAVWCPIVMKKGRPAFQLRVLCARDKLLLLQREILLQTSTIGLRFYEVDKLELPREIKRLETAFGEVPVKIARIGDQVVNVAPEYEACKQIAETFKVSIKQVYQTALSAAVAQYGNVQDTIDLSDMY